MSKSIFNPFYGHAPAHVAAFGGRLLMGAHAPRFHPESEGGEGEQRYSRAEWVAKEKAEQATKSVDVLAERNANLQWDLNEAKRKVPGADQVVVSKEDAAALATYREHFATPADAKKAREGLAQSEERDAMRAYDEKRTELLGKVKDLPENYKALVMTAEELAKRPGGAEMIRDLALLEADVTRVATSFGATVEDAKKADVGVPPNHVTGSGAQSAAGTKSTVWDRRHNPDKKE
ncbi:hypothetical protein DM785_02645 [Deinococcus actinosclerus]|nr:hypothetical protein DM785_02645 [Deinococcus actinosclerus]